MATDMVAHTILLLSVVGVDRRWGSSLHVVDRMPRRLGIFPRVVQSFFLPIVPALRRAACAVPVLALSWSDTINTIYSVICIC